MIHRLFPSSLLLFFLILLPLAAQEGTYVNVSVLNLDTASGPLKADIVGVPISTDYVPFGRMGGAGDFLDPHPGSLIANILDTARQLYHEGAPINDQLNLIVAYRGRIRSHGSYIYQNARGYANLLDRSLRPLFRRSGDSTLRVSIGEGDILLASDEQFSMLRQDYLFMHLSDTSQWVLPGGGMIHSGGESLIDLSTAHLAPGVYRVVVRTDARMIRSHPLVVSR